MGGGEEKQEGDTEGTPNTMCSMNHKDFAASEAQPKVSVKWPEILGYGV